MRRVLARSGAVMAAAMLVMGAVLLAAAPALAGVTGGCEGSADFSADSVGAYTPDFDTRGNPIIVPKDDGNQASWQGSVPGENRNFSGKVEIRLGPAWLEVADWGFPDHDGSNVNDERSDSGDYDMDEVWDVIPKNIVHGIYEARASHSASAVDCEAQFFVKFEGNPLSSPLVLGAIALLAVFGYLMVLAGRRRAAAAFFRGRPVLGAVAGLLAGPMIAILLQQFAVWPLDNLTVIVLPLVMIGIGLLIAKAAPFGGSGGGTPPPAGDDPIFADGFESGDTSAWTDDA